MKVRYRVLDFNKEENTMEVRFFTDVITEDMLADHFDNEGNIVYTEHGYPERCRTDMNISINNLNPTKKYILETIRNCAPSQWLNTKEDILKGVVTTNLDEVKKLIDNNVYSFDWEPPKPVNDFFDVDDVLTESNVAKIIAKLKEAKAI